MGYKKKSELDELTLEPIIRSCHSGQQIPCFDSCELTIIWMSIIKLNTGYMLHVTFHIGFPVVRPNGGVDERPVQSRYYQNFLDAYM